MSWGEGSMIASAPLIHRSVSALASASEIALYAWTTVSRPICFISVPNLAFICLA